MSLFETIIIAIVEGLTEFLPVSSTGHMIITQALLGVESTEFVKAFTVNIQFGAILSVIVLYWKRFFQSWDFYYKLFIAFLPAAIIGLLFIDYIDALLESVLVVAIMLVLGGVLMLFVDKWFNKPITDQKVGWKRALIIGFYQCIAMIPGVSRSMATIVGGMTTKLTRKNAAEFSFFLAVPTMAAAGGYKLLKLLTDPSGVAMIQENLITLLIGNVVAFIVAMGAIKFFINFLTKHGFKAFGYYRIIVGGILLLLLFTGTELSIL
ncbi:MAG: undecaprenyl-diphosphate phosphatase [Dysgonamonadaceae bacterium]|jgi:undecaprenyl-diphosphatase|nr:undecaprenyl-diphosphate phosphatase [Dysgonamonadaceae bacterium]MDD3356977.1 undecaprenyl-diphosphate phosphatase [Dysgonamonadaceae bacterium]MDD3727976.1 undecaprenyl-diphosphate phosphatase [Dysgonamonadaceae bacterium]MDD4245694.1 undecaprenyl-diphosphate phosphatase [Dysgonamonadaceae bacterium]MDD4605299.1 undecaprenyl-diphosphate phosphatase [Dysgonamonadaceae bacterium]